MKKITREQQIQAATKLDIPLAALLAVQEVEARADGFLKDGRVVILFERHIMFKQLKNKGLNANAFAEKFPDIVNQTSGGYKGGTSEHSRLNVAKQICSTSAIESTSYGLFQIMGFHWPKLGYQSAQEYEQKMSENESNQLDAFVRFVELNPKMKKALQVQDWPTFAKLYNGPAYAKNRYDEKMRIAFEKFANAD